MSYPWYELHVHFYGEDAPVSFESTGMTIAHAMESLLEDLQSPERYPEYYTKEVLGVTYVRCLTEGYDPLPTGKADLIKQVAQEPGDDLLHRMAREILKRNAGPWIQ